MARADITSPANPRIRRLVGLRDRRERDRESVFLVEGADDLERALAGGLEPLEVYYDPSLFSDPPYRGDLAVSVATEALDRASYRGRSQGVIGVLTQPDVRIDRLNPGPAPLILMVEAIEKPGNLGALLRTADAVGADALIAADPTTDPFGPNVIRASTGALFTVPLAVTDLETAVEWLQERRIRIVAGDPGSPELLWEADLTGPVALLVGPEHAGLSDKARTSSHALVTIPMQGSADSLNVSVSMAVLAYEALRQRTQDPPPMTHNAS
jgi:TrmH family RNA methyltransferase